MIRHDFIAGVLATTAGAPAPELRKIEARSGALLGVAARDVGTKREIGQREDERFPLASTFKLPLVMAVLDRVDRGRDRLDRHISFTTADLEPPYSVIAERYPHGGRLTLGEIAALTISHSDNTGADLLLRRIGGPFAVTQYVRRLGVEGIRVDSSERRLPLVANLTDPRNTGTPRAMCDLLARLAVRSPLSGESTVHLLSWMRATVTGKGRLRAGVPGGWSVADKTGTLDNAAADVGLLFPRAGSPIAIAVYVARPTGSLDTGETTIAATTRAVVSALRR